MNLLHFLGNFLSLLSGLVNITNHVKGSFRQIVMLSFQNFLETTDGINQLDVSAFVAGKDLSSGEGLTHETLDLTGTFDS